MALSGSKKALLWGAFFIVCLLNTAALADSCSLPDIGERVVSSRVIDGDTLELVDGRRVRLIGVNTPEIGRRGAPSEPYAQKARSELQRLVGKAGLRLLVGEDARDNYGRTLGHLFDAQGANIEAQLLRQGLGFAVGIPPNVTLLDCHLQQERQARRQRLGVWQQAPVKRAAEVSQGGFQLIRGRIVTVQTQGRHIWVELDGPLVLRLPVDLPGAAGIASWRGRELEVRGWVVDRGSSRRGHKRFMLPLLEWRLAHLE